MTQDKVQAGLTGRVVVITGGAQGIGATVAKTLAAAGAHISICDLAAATAVVEAIRSEGGQAIAHACDVTNSQQVAQAVAATVERFGAVHGLVNNAALFATLRPRRLEEWDAAEFDKVLQVNVRGPFEFIKAVTPVMRGQRYGKIINISSGTVFKGTPMMLPYVASKGAVVALTRSVARELGEYGIRANCIAPGFTVSDGVVSNRENHEMSLRIAATARCIEREQTPDDLAGAVRFLLSPESDFITGQTLVVDGGSVMH